MSLKSEIKSKYMWKTVLFTFLAALISLLPAVILGRGMLLFSDDFTYQQQIFNIFYGDLFKGGNVFGWSYLTDLGSGTVSSYSFYGLFSPFTLIFAFLPSNVIPYMTAPLLAVKYTFAGLFAFLYIKRFVKDQNTAVFGAVLYAFCGLQTINLIFPFHDATALFPLLLIGIEEAVDEGRQNKGIFKGTGLMAIAIFLCAITNYYLFFGQVIFAIIYFLFRFSIGRNWKGLLRCLLAGVLGVALASFVLIPSAIQVLENPRISGTTTALLFNWREYLTILEAYFMPTDVMGARNSMFQHECSSCGLTLPFVAMSLCFAYGYKNKKSRLTWLCVVLAVISFVPVLNSAFSLFNSHYYARWFYMFALVLALASSKALDDADKNRKELKFGAIANGICTLVVVIASVAVIILYKIKKSNWVNGNMLGLYLVAGLVFSLLTILIIFKKKKNLTGTLIACTIAVAILTTGTAGIRYSMGTHETTGYVSNVTNMEGQIGIDEAKKILNIENNIKDDEQNFRIRTDNYEAGTDYFVNSYDNVSLLLKVPSVNSFISTVSGGIFEFYEAIGFDRNVRTTSDFSEELMLLLSCKYHLVNGNELTRYEYFLPMGFSYEKYITTEEFEKLDDNMKVYAMLAFIVTDEETALTHGDVNAISSDISNYVDRDVCSDFKYNNSGFTAKITAEKSEMIFFSVPCDSGFKAYVNGKETTIYDDNGLSAIWVNEGENNIEFTYKTPGLEAGVICGAVSAVIIVAMFVTDGIVKRRKERWHS